MHSRLLSNQSRGTLRSYTHRSVQHCFKSNIPNTHMDKNKISLTVSAHVCLVDRAPVLTVVGELHSLTDWQVSDASEDAELDDFCKRDKNRQAISRTVKKYMINTL